MKSRVLLGILLAMIVLSACSQKLDSAQTTAIASDASTIFKNKSRGELPAQEWPASISKLNPDRVYISSDGLYIVLSSSFVEENGVFVPSSTGFEPIPGGDPSYEQLSNGVFTYEIKG